VRGRAAIDLVGERFGELIVLARAGSNRARASLWECQCDCGKKKTINRTSLVSGHTKSCGCLHRRANGEAANGRQTPEYTAWAQMIRRCESKDHKKWHRYGGRGISVCKEWRESFHAFLAYTGRRPTKLHSLDRYPNRNGNYEPGNVRWATRAEQQANRDPFLHLSWREAPKHAYGIVRDFEMVLCSYTGAKYAVAVESCTAALFLCCAYLKVKEVSIPKLTYCSVPMQIMHAGGKVKFRDEDWIGSYQLAPYPIYDCARHFTANMYQPGTFQCLSFHWNKHLPIGRGGAILFDDKDAVEWFKRARFDGRKEGIAPKNDKGIMLGWHFYMTPPQAAQGMMLMGGIAEHNPPLPNDPYPDLSQMKIFQ
jgi:hypothetical protein